MLPGDNLVNVKRLIQGASQTWWSPFCILTDVFLLIFQRVLLICTKGNKSFPKKLFYSYDKAIVSGLHYRLIQLTIIYNMRIPMKKLLLTAFITCLLLPSLALADTHYVTVSGAGTKDGSSWSNAHEGLQAALTAATSGDQIWVQFGTYYTSEVSGSQTDRNQSFSMKNGVEIYGGFAGSETAVSQRYDYGYNGIHETIISGDIGTVGVDNDNSYFVFVNNNPINTTAVLDGVTVCHGYVIDQNMGGSQSSGAGIKNRYASPTIRNCTFHHNAAVSGGAISFFYGGQCSVTNCVFFENSASYTGGAVECFYTNGHKWINCIFSNNYCDGYGGASSETFCTNNEYINCVFTGNNNTIYGGGAIAIAAANGATIRNCTYRNNTGGRGGAVYTESCSATIYNSIFFNNISPYGTHFYGTNVLYNSCIYPYDGNSGAGVQTNSIYVNPCFASDNDSRLLPCSPCIDRGNNSYCSESTDMTGNSRIYNTIDLGAYEYHSPSFSFRLTANPSTNTNSIYGVCAMCEGETAGILVSTETDPVVGGAGVLTFSISPDGNNNFSTDLTGLEQGRNYYYRIYRQYSDGSIDYTESVFFTAIPTLGEWGLIAFGGLIALIGGVVVWRRFV